MPGSQERFEMWRFRTLCSHDYTESYGTIAPERQPPSACTAPFEEELP